MKKYIIAGLLVVSFIISPVFVSAQTSQSEQLNTLIRLLQSLVQLLQQQLLVAQGQSPVTQSLSTPQPLQNPNNQTSGWKTYRGASFEFQYPPILSLVQQGETVFLTHSVAYRHPNPCDLRGDGQPLDKITDFNISLEVVDANLKDTVKANEGDFLTENYFQGATLLTSPGFIDELGLGSLRGGYRVTSGAEGCGRFNYYFPLSANKTLFVHRSFIPEFKSINRDYQKYLSVSGTIAPNQEEDFFRNIFYSFNFRG